MYEDIQQIDNEIQEALDKIAEKYDITINYNNFNWEYNVFKNTR